MLKGLVNNVRSLLLSGICRMAGSMLVLGLVFLAGSCTDQNDGKGEENPAPTLRPICFSAGSVQTRATSKTSIVTSDNFYILAFDNLTKDLYIGSSSGSGASLTYSGIELTYYNTSNSLDLWAPADGRTLYWPGGALDFCGYYNPAGTSIPHNSDRQMVYTVDNTITNQKDLLYAYKEEVSSRDGDITENTFEPTPGSGLRTQTVPLVFNHALTQVGFQASVGQNWNVTVNSITIHNVYNAGTFNYATAAWTNTGTPNNAITFTLATPKVFNGVSSPASLAATGNEVLILMPQTLGNPWQPSTSNPISAANTNRQSYVDIECKIQKRSDSGYFVGSASSYGHVYAPIDGTWGVGKICTYQIAFGAGYDANGKPTISYFQLSAMITDWVEGTTTSGQAKFD